MAEEALGRWADGPVRLEQICLHVSFTIMPTMILMDGLIGKLVFTAMLLLCGTLPLVLGLGLVGGAGVASPSRMRRVAIILGALAVALVMLLLVSIIKEEVPLSKVASDAMFTCGIGLLALAMWAWGEALRHQWVAAPAGRTEILACVSAFAVLIGLFTVNQGWRALLAAAGLYIAVCGLPFAFGLGLFARAGTSTPGRLRRVITIMLVLISALTFLGLILILWREMPFSGAAWNAFALGCAAILAWPIWLAGRRFRRRWAGARTALAEVVISSGVVILGFIAFAQGNLGSQDTALLGLHVALCSLPLALGVSGFGQRAA